LSRGDTQGWYGDAPLALEAWMPVVGVAAPFDTGACPESPRWWPCWPLENGWNVRMGMGIGSGLQPSWVMGVVPLSRGDTPGWCRVTRRWRSEHGCLWRVWLRRLVPGNVRNPAMVAVLAPGKQMGMGIPGNVRNPRVGTAVGVRLGFEYPHGHGFGLGIRGATPRNHTSPGRWPGKPNKKENRGLKARSIHAPKEMFVRGMRGMEEILAQGR